MSSRVARIILERVTSLDQNLSERFGRRTPERLARGLVRVTSQWGNRINASGDASGPLSTTSLETDSVFGTVVRGLEVYFATGGGSTLRVTDGTLSLKWTPPADEVRPGLWAGKVEGDDEICGLFDLPVVTAATPSVPIGAALAQAEWWVVHVTPSEQNIETNSGGFAFNEGTGVFDPYTIVKVKGHRLSVTVLRGAAGASLATTLALVPAAARSLAWVRVPTGATDLSSALIFDTRRLVEPGPNRVEGAWQCPTTGEITTPFGGKGVFLGVVRARVGGEWLEVRTSLGLDLTQICEPSANWGSSGATDKIAWLYLAKVNGSVPRWRRWGASEAGNVATEGTFMSGALVLSPTPPKVRCADTIHVSGNRWDMRPSAALALPTTTIGSVAFEWAGNTTLSLDDAVCVGFFLYRNVDAAGSGTPQVLGPYYCNDGWVTGDEIAQSTGMAALLTSVTIGGSGSGTVTLTFVLNTMTSGGISVTMPFDGVAGGLYGTFSAGAAGQMTWYGAECADIQLATSGGAYNWVRTNRVRTQYPGAKTFQTHLGTAASGTITSTTRYLAGVRMPYNEPLVT